MDKRTSDLKWFSINSNCERLSIKVMFLLFLLEHARGCPSECFCKVPDMQCEGFTEETFKNLYVPNDVTRVSIKKSQINALSKKNVANLRNLSELEIVGCGIKTVGKSAFTSFNQMTKLVLSGNELNTLQPDIFLGFINLKYLDLSKNNISFLPKGVFHALTNIIEIRLMYNVIRNIPNSVFTMLPKLRLLYLSYNKIEEIENEAFQNLTLDWFSLAKNNILQIPTSAFKGMRISTSIMLLGNPFDCICKYAIDYAVNLSHLKNKLTAYCATPLSVADKHLSIAHEELLCTQCDLHLCQNNAQCIGDESNYRCQCQEKFKGRHCEINICNQIDDKMLLPEESTNISPDGNLIRFNNVMYVRLTEEGVKQETLSCKQEKLLIFICGTELVIISLFLSVWAYKRYVAKKDKIQNNNEVRVKIAPEYKT